MFSMICYFSLFILIQMQMNMTMWFVSTKNIQFGGLVCIFGFGSRLMHFWAKSRLVFFMFFPRTLP